MTRLRSRGSGGGAARRKARTSIEIEFTKFIERKIPTYEYLSDEALDIIESNAESVLQEIGVRFSDNQSALNLWKNAGADIKGDIVRIPKGLAKSLCSTIPSKFFQKARNPERSVEIGGNSMVLAPVYGPPFIRTVEEGRRYATMSDFNQLVKLGYSSKWLHHSGGTVCEPTDIPVNKRHLDMNFTRAINKNKFN